MKESEIRQLFLKISNLFNGFAYDDYKVEIWREQLADVPFELASENLRKYANDPDNSYPPHPGKLAVRPIQKADSRYIPSAEETRLMLEQQDKEWAEKAVPPPPELKAMVMRIGKGRSSDVQ